MATLTEIREALAESLEAVTDLNVSAYQQAAPVLPTVYVLPQSISYHMAMGTVSGAISEMSFLVRVLVKGGLDKGAQMLLDELVTAGTIPAAIEADRTLGGVVDALVVDGLTGYDPVILGENIEAWRAEWSVRVWP